jgi:tripartite-type tricarboxylate transporter receptor subunit TctC
VVENRPGGDGLVSLNAFVGAHDDHTMWFGPAGTFNVLPYQHDTLPFDPKRDLNPVASVSEVVLAVSTPVSMNVNSIDELVAIARAQPGKLNAAAANGISDFLLFGFFKSMGLQIVKVPYRDIMQAPGDVACGGAAVEQGRPHQGAGGDQPAARAQRARRSDRGGSRLSSADIREHRRGVRPARHGGQIAREHCGGFPKNRRGSDHRRLGDTGQIMSVLGPAQFGARVQEQRDKLAALAKTLGAKATQ